MTHEHPMMMEGSGSAAGMEHSWVLPQNTLKCLKMSSIRLSE